MLLFVCVCLCLCCLDIAFWLQCLLLCVGLVSCLCLAYLCLLFVGCYVVWFFALFGLLVCTCCLFVCGCLRVLLFVGLFCWVLILLVGLRLVLDVFVIWLLIGFLFGFLCWCLCVLVCFVRLCLVCLVFLFVLCIRLRCWLVLQVYLPLLSVVVNSFALVFCCDFVFVLVAWLLRVFVGYVGVLFVVCIDCFGFGCLLYLLNLLSFWIWLFYIAS